MIKGNKIGDKIEYITPPELHELDKIGERLHDVNILVTPYNVRIKPLLQLHFPEAKWEWQETTPDAAQLAKTALEKFNRGEASYDSHLNLLYLRKTQAEIEKGKEGDGVRRQ